MHLFSRTLKNDRDILKTTVWFGWEKLPCAIWFTGNQFVLSKQSSQWMPDLDEIFGSVSSKSMCIYASRLVRWWIPMREMCVSYKFHCIVQCLIPVRSGSSAAHGSKTWNTSSFSWRISKYRDTGEQPEGRHRSPIIPVEMHSNSVRLDATKRINHHGISRIHLVKLHHESKPYNILLYRQSVTFGRDSLLYMPQWEVYIKPASLSMSNLLFPPSSSHSLQQAILQKPTLQSQSLDKYLHEIIYIQNIKMKFFTIIVATLIAVVAASPMPAAEAEAEALDKRSSCQYGCGSSICYAQCISSQKCTSVGCQPK